MESDETPEKENEEPVNDSDQNVEENTESTSALCQTPAPLKNLHKRKATTEDKRLDRAFKILETTSQIIQDDCQHFGNLVASKLRKFNEDIRSNLESDIMELVVKANIGFYNILCNYPQEQTPIHQTSQSVPVTSHLSSQCSPYASVTIEPINASSVFSPSSVMSEDSFIITDLL